MENIKEIIAKNLVTLRKKNKMTQQTLAEKLNYSDKAISRWEHAETLPDIETLCRVCEIFGVSFEYLLQKEQPEDNKNPYVKSSSNLVSQICIMLIAAASVWLIAAIAFVYVQMNTGEMRWMYFIWAIPATVLTLAICNKLFFSNRIFGIINSSFFNWTLILAIYLEILDYNLWMIFLVGLPVEAIIILSATLKKHKQK